MNQKIKVIELFAGVGGFRLGLEGWRNKSASSGYKDDFESPYIVVWSNQWEPSTKTQHASKVYENRWGTTNHSNEDIASVDVTEIPDHDMLVGGFPCQDYSVATTLKNSKGLIGKKGVLWWSIHKILSEKKNKPKYLFLENVDRLLISPSGQRGRDFAIILKSLDELGYAVEWRVVNAAEYGMPQRRKRIFIIGYLKDCSIHQELKHTEPLQWILEDGILANALPVSASLKLQSSKFYLNGDIVSISEHFNKTSDTGSFENSGLMLDGQVFTIKTVPTYEGATMKLGDILEANNIPDEFFIDEKNIDKWTYLKGAKKEIRVKSDGFQYNYAEGAMVFPDPLNRPSRTIITGEGGASPSRFKHVVKTNSGYRRLTPIELERLNMFPDDHTRLEGVSDTKRAFFMGNALVVGVIEKIGTTIAERTFNGITLRSQQQTVNL